MPERLDRWARDAIYGCVNCVKKFCHYPNGQVKAEGF